MPEKSVLVGIGAVVIAIGGILVLGGMRAAPDNPLPDAKNRPQLLRFGMYVTPDPAQNPIDPPERFIGYHAGLDFEIFEGEAEKEIPVTAACEGSVIQSGFIEGYGGVVVQRCTLRGEEVTVLYGHLDLNSLAAVDTNLETGQKLGTLAPAHSESSGQNRKHLHLGIHKGSEVDVRGYVQREDELKNFLDPKEVLSL